MEVISNATWTAVPQVDWIKDAKEGDEGNLIFNVDANPQSVSRDGKIRFIFAGSDYTKDLIVRQAAKPSDASEDETCQYSYCYVAIIFENP